MISGTYAGDGEIIQSPVMWEGVVLNMAIVELVRTIVTVMSKKNSAMKDVRWISPSFQQEDQPQHQMNTNCWGLDSVVHRIAISPNPSAERTDIGKMESQTMSVEIFVITTLFVWVMLRLHRHITIQIDATFTEATLQLRYLQDGMISCMTTTLLDRFQIIMGLRAIEDGIMSVDTCGRDSANVLLKAVILKVAQGLIHL
jgi:hypothetical protein